VTEPTDRTYDMLQQIGEFLKKLKKEEYDALVAGESRLMVVPKGGGDPEKVTDWSAGHGDEFEVDGHTNLKRSDIDRVEIWNAEDKVLMTYKP